MRVPHAGMAVTIDLGEWNDIHPGNKKPVCERLALAAQKIAYGEKEIVYSGPTYQSQKIEGDEIVVSFSNVGSGLIAIDDEPLYHFAIAKAVNEFNKIVVWSDHVPNPQFVRYAWADNPAGANLYNKEGLPASPFTTATDLEAAKPFDSRVSNASIRSMAIIFRKLRTVKKSFI